MDKKLYKLMNWPLIEEIVYSESSNPHRILGAQKAGSQTLVQAFFPGAKEVYLHWTQKEKDRQKGKLATYVYDAKMEQADEVGFYAVLVPAKKLDSYVFKVIYEDGRECSMEDPYRFDPVISKEDIEKFSNGVNYEIYEKLGAHPMKMDGVWGVLFAVWAPNCLRVSVVGDFNGWDGRIHQMRKIWDSGVFELFVPDVPMGSNYKFELKLKNGLTYLKADPYANACQLRPETASVVTDLTDFTWEDQEFVENREDYQTGNVPMSIYELYLGSVMEQKDGVFPNYRELAKKIITYVKEMGYTHVELMPVTEYPSDHCWGYQTTGYFAPTARYGSPEDFMFFVNELHKAGIGVLMDFAAQHFPKDDFGLASFDGTCLYEHQDPRKGVSPKWNTLLFNYGRPEVSNFLIASALFWVEKYHVDGIRMESVASMYYLNYDRKDGAWIPNMYGGSENLDAIDMIKHLNSVLKKRNPGVLSISDTPIVDDEQLGFDLTWNPGFVNGYLDYIKYDPYFRAHHHGELTFSMVYAYTEKYILAFSHHYLVNGQGSMLGKMPGMREQKFSNLRLTYAYMLAHPGKKLLFMGQDIAEFDEWNEKRCVEWNLPDYPGHRGVKELIKALHQLYQEQRALYELDDVPEGFEWINNIAANECYLSFARKGKRTEDTILVVANFSGIEEEITTGVPIPGKYRELLNTDAKAFDGSGMVNAKMISSKEQPCDDREESITVKLAPLSLTFLQYVPFTKADLKRREEMKALIAAKEALRVQQEAEKEALEAAAKAQEHQKLLEKEMKEAKLAAKHAMESLEQAKKNTENAMHLVEEESIKLEGKKGKKVE